MKAATWKSEERSVAKLFGNKRALMTGTDEKSDVESSVFAIDCKLRARWDVEKWFSELLVYSEKQSKIPILSLKKPGKRGGRLAVVKMDTLISLLKASGFLPEAENLKDEMQESRM